MIENGGVGMGTRSHLAQGSYLVRDSQNAKEIPRCYSYQHLLRTLQWEVEGKFLPSDHCLHIIATRFGLATSLKRYPRASTSRKASRQFQPMSGPSSWSAPHFPHVFPSFSRQDQKLVIVNHPSHNWLRLRFFLYRYSFYFSSRLVVVI